MYLHLTPLYVLKPMGITTQEAIHNLCGISKQAASFVCINLEEWQPSNYISEILLTKMFTGEILLDFIPEIGTPRSQPLTL